jgi:hypothetical protein
MSKSIATGAWAPARARSLFPGCSPSAMTARPGSSAPPTKTTRPSRTSSASAPRPPCAWSVNERPRSPPRARSSSTCASGTSIFQPPVEVSTSASRLTSCQWHRSVLGSTSTTTTGSEQGIETVGVAVQLGVIKGTLELKDIVFHGAHPSAGPPVAGRGIQFPGPCRACSTPQAGRQEGAAPRQEENPDTPSLTAHNGYHERRKHR